jgi:hypothetical protein
MLSNAILKAGTAFLEKQRKYKRLVLSAESYSIRLYDVNKGTLISQNWFTSPNSIWSFPLENIICLRNSWFAKWKMSYATAKAKFITQTTSISRKVRRYTHLHWNLMLESILYHIFIFLILFSFAIRINRVSTPLYKVGAGTFVN